MAENTRLTGIELNGQLYSLGKTIYEELDISLERFAELLGRDLYCPTLSAAPSSSTLTYTDTDGEEHHFQIGQSCVYPNENVSDGYSIAFLKAVEDGVAVWQDLGDILAGSEQAALIAQEANEYAKMAYTRSGEAVETANVAKEAVAALEGLANADEAQQTLAAQVTQIAQNSSDVALLKEKHQVMSEEEYESLELVDKEKIYMLYEE